MGNHSKFVCSSDAVLTEMPDGTAVILDLATNFYFSLNDTGLALWKLLDDRESPLGAEELVTALMAHYAVKREQLAKDVEQVLSSLLQERLVSKVSEGHGDVAGPT